MHAPNIVKKVALAALTGPVLPRLFTPLLQGRAIMFMLHRFSVPDLGVFGDEPAHLRRVLEYLRRHRYSLVGLSDLMDRLQGQGPPPYKAVAFTLDDGYFDEVTVAGPVFAEFDCPATTFVTTGFLDGQLWNWWDKIEHVFERCRKTSVEVELDGDLLRFSWEALSERERVKKAFTLRCKLVANSEKLAAIERLAAAAEVELPAKPPAKYAPVAWDELRSAEARGMTFGPHTVTHPVLSRTPDDQSHREIVDSWPRLPVLSRTPDDKSHREIVDSWPRLQAMARQPVPVFCYPNGQLSDFGPREINSMRGAGLRAAVVGTSGYADAASFGRPDGPYYVHRFGLPADMPHVVQVVSGMERAKELVRRLR
jgi:peptidoglycan/xylan/chitin deacetylase (PgdA/CDA1 family)